MTALDAVREKLKRRFDENPRIHISVALSHPRIHFQDHAAVIKAVYPHIFRIEEEKTGACHTVQYADLLTGQVRIRELLER